jgi:hypothetical protein
VISKPALEWYDGFSPVTQQGWGNKGENAKKNKLE